MPKIAIVAALEREVQPLVRDWRSQVREFEGRSLRFFEKDEVVLVCGGIGAEAARRATEAAISLYAPAVVYSAGFAGGLDRTLKIGAIVTPRQVVDARDGSRFDTGKGEGTLVSFDSVADPEQKSRLAESYGAVAIDMEAAAVAKGAQARGVRFGAVKAISDESGFKMPPFERFVGADGRFRAAAFVWFAMLRPWWWATLLRLAADSRLAARELCRALTRLDHAMAEELETSGGRFTTR